MFGTLPCPRLAVVQLHREPEYFRLRLAQLVQNRRHHADLLRIRSPCSETEISS